MTTPNNLHRCDRFGALAMSLTPSMAGMVCEDCMAVSAIVSDDRWNSERSFAWLSPKHWVGLAFRISWRRE